MAAMWVRFDEAFDYTPSRRPQVTIAYPAGHVGSVTRECGGKAVRLGFAVEVSPLDHDGDGRKGGSRAQADQTDG